MSSKKPSIDTKLIRELAEMLRETDLTEIEIMEDEMSIRLSRGGTSMAAMAQPTMVHQAVAAPVPAAAPAPAAEPTASAAAPAPTSSGKPVPSPMVGTAYYSPAPGADAFVNVGSKVKKGQTIMIVEAMKTMNQIPAPHDGTVTEITVDDGQPVEYGETLIVME